MADLAPERATLKQDMVAGVPGAISSVREGMAAGVLAGVSPVHGLYASIFVCLHCPVVRLDEGGHGSGHRVY